MNEHAGCCSQELKEQAGKWDQQATTGLIEMTVKEWSKVTNEIHSPVAAFFGHTWKLSVEKGANDTLSWFVSRTDKEPVRDGPYSYWCAVRKRTGATAAWTSTLSTQTLPEGEWWGQKARVSMATLTLAGGYKADEDVLTVAVGFSRTAWWAKP